MGGGGMAKEPRIQDIQDSLAGLPEDQRVMAMQITSMTQEQLNQLPYADRERALLIRNSNFANVRH
jgi:hypothetical protein